MSIKDEDSRSIGTCLSTVYDVIDNSSDTYYTDKEEFLEALEALELLYGILKGFDRPSYRLMLKDVETKLEKLKSLYPKFYKHIVRIRGTRVN